MPWMKELLSVPLRHGHRSPKSQHKCIGGTFTEEHIMLISPAHAFRAALGLYHAKGYTAKGHDLAFLILKVGGPMLLTAIHKAGYLPNIKFLHTHLEGELPPLQPFFGVDLLEILGHNLEAVLLRSAHSDTK